MTYDSEVLADSPIVYWKIDEGPGDFPTMFDSSGNVHDGSLGFSTQTMEQPPNVDGAVGTFSMRREFGSAAPNVDLTDVAAAGSSYLETGPWAVEFWLTLEHAAQTGPDVGIAAVQSGFGESLWAVVIQGDRQGFGVTNDVLSGPFAFTALPDPLNDDEPHQFVAEFDGTDVTCYLDGAAVTGPDPFTLGVLTPATDVLLRYGNSVGPDDVDGGFDFPNGWTYDNFSFYGAPLGATRVLAHYTAGLIPPPPPPAQDVTAEPARRAAQARGPISRPADAGPGGGGDTGGPSAPVAVVPDITSGLFRLADLATQVNALANGRSRQWTDALNDPGSGSFLMQLDDPDLGALQWDANDLVRFTYKGFAAFMMIVEQYEWVEVGQAEEAARAVTLSGRGHLALLERGLVYPARGVNADAFTWFLPTYNDETWTPANVVTAGAGATIAGGTFPDATADDIWGFPGLPAYAPPGPCWFRMPFNLAGGASLDFAFAQDDYGTVYLDGEFLITLTQPVTGFGGVTELNDVFVDTGDHVLAIEVINRFDGRPPPGNPGGLVAAVLLHGTSTVITHTDGSVLVRSYPQHTPQFPIEEDRTFTWSSLGFDDSGWGPANAITTVSGAQSSWTPNWSDEFPDGAASVLWAPGTTISDAPEGDCYFRKMVTVASAGKYLLYALADNSAEVYVDGALVINIDPTFNSFTKVSTETIALDEGEHLIAIHANNSFDYGAPGNNPGGVAFAMYSTDVDGSTALGLVSETGTDWLAVHYPQETPGMTPGRVIRMVVDEMQARGVLPALTLGFTDAADSDGVAWPVVGDIATKVGNDVLTFIRELTATYVDVWMRPSGLVLDAWVAGSRGADSGVDFHAVTDPADPLSGNLTGLVFKGHT